MGREILNRKGRRTRLLRAAILASVTLPGTAIAGDVIGTISSASLDRPARGVTVIIKETGQSVGTDQNGRYSMLGLDAGTYTLLIVQPGYKDQRMTVTVPQQGSVTADASIELEGETTDGAIVVTGARTSRLLAIERKRSLSVISDIVSSDGIGKLPDYNTAEAAASGNLGRN